MAMCNFHKSRRTKPLIENAFEAIFVVAAAGHKMNFGYDMFP